MVPLHAACTGRCAVRGERENASKANRKRRKIGITFAAVFGTHERGPGHCHQAGHEANELRAISDAHEPYPRRGFGVGVHLVLG